MMMVVTIVYQMDEPSWGKEVHPVIPAEDSPVGTSEAMSVSPSREEPTPPRAAKVKIIMALIPNTIMEPCRASVYMTAINPPNTT